MSFSIISLVRASVRARLVGAPSFSFRGFASLSSPVLQSSTPAASSSGDDCGDDLDYDSEDDMVPMIDPSTGEWGGPTKGGTAPEPTRYGDWERKGRCTDFN